jgi:NhaA family Na+:H+ antiporter
LLKLRDNRYYALTEEERDEDGDGVPDIYGQDSPGYHLRMAAILERKAAEHRRLAELAGDSRKEEGP